jgi:pyruvate/2-oxoacid:ferredoxin oxidoreductase alpha subunit
MKKIIFTLAAIMMVSISSVSMASNRGGHHRGDCKEISIEVYENYRTRHNRNYDNDRRYEEPRDYNNYDNRDRDNWNREDEGREYRECRDRDRRHYNRRDYRENSDAKVVGTVLGAAALLILATSH